MNEYNSARWERLKQLNIEFNYVKCIVKEIYECEVKEKSLDEFLRNLDWYKVISEYELLNKLEENTYKRIFVFSIEKYKKNKEEPFISDMTNSLFRSYFKEKCMGKLKNNEYFNGTLDSNFRVVYYNINIQDGFATFKMAKYFEANFSESNEDGTKDNYTKEIYDCCQFYIDLTNRLIFMHFNDIKDIDINISKQITEKKSQFRALFTNVTSKNMLKYVITRYLETYFKNYMDDIRNGNPRKLVSIIEASSYDYKDNNKSLIRSVERSYEHSPKRLEAIENDIGENKNLTITEIECKTNEITIDLRGDGEIYCINSFFYKEVIKNVCSEFFNGYKLS